MKTFGWISIGLFFLWLQLNPAFSLAEDLVKAISLPTQQVQPLFVGGSVVLQFTQPIKKTTLGNETLAASVPVSPTEIVVTAKASGTTALTIWGWDEKPLAIRVLEITVNIAPLKLKISRDFPGENNLTITALLDTIILTGSVSTSDVKDKIEGLAKIYAPDKVLNHLSLVLGIIDIDSLKSDIKHEFPDEKNWNVIPLYDFVILSGEVSTSDVKARLDRLTKIHTGVNEKVFNFLTVNRNSR